MKKTFVVSLLVSAALLGLSGCASDQGPKNEQVKKVEKPKDTRPMEQRLSVGLTKDQVREAIGNPKGTSMNSDGTESWTYSDTEKGFIPYYRLSGGKFHHLIVNFDKDAKVKSWSSGEEGLY